MVLKLLGGKCLDNRIDYSLQKGKMERADNHHLNQ